MGAGIADASGHRVRDFRDDQAVHDLPVASAQYFVWKCERGLLRHEDNVADEIVRRESALLLLLVSSRLTTDAAFTGAFRRRTRG